MKKLVFLSILLSSSYLISQNEDNEKPKVKTDFYIGIGLVGQNVKLNNNLKASNVATLNETIPDFSIGLNFFHEKYSGDVEFSGAISKNDNANSENLYANSSARLRFHYNAVNKEKYAFTTGLNLVYSRMDATFYSKNNVVDLNNLQPSNNFGEFSLYNNAFFAGPSVSFYILKHKKNPIRINLGYEFALINGKWRSDFASINNSIRESNNNRFVVSISLL